MKKLEILTEFPIAEYSKDHTVPKGTMQDNLHAPGFVDNIIDKLGTSMSFLDLGCAGGGMPFDFLSRGVLGVGVDGSDYSKKIKRAHWGDSAADYLFTADITKPFSFREISDSEENVGLHKFTLITSFDVMEHMHNVDEATAMIKNVYDNLSEDGYTMHSIANFPDEGYHHILESEEWWINLFEANGFKHNEIIEKYQYARASSYNLTFKKWDK